MALTSAVQTETVLTTGDLIVVIIYFLVVIAIGIYASCRASRGTVGGYFLAGRKMLWPMVGASLFVSNIGSEHFIGLSGSGAAGGIWPGAWEFNAVLLLQLLGFVFLPVYLAGQVYTMPEYLEKRFGGSRLRIYMAILSLIMYIFTKCSVDLYTGGIFIQQSLRWDLYLCIFILIVVVGILTITGGLTAVIYTDTLQAALMVLGAIVLMGFGFKEVGGFDGLWRQFPNAEITNSSLLFPNKTCHKVDEHWDVMLRKIDDPHLPWAGFLFGQTPASIWYWCADQVIVQRALAARSLSHAQGATIMTGFIKILPLFIMVMPGMMARILYTDDIACVRPEHCMSVCQSRAGCTNIAYPKLVLGLLPTGLRGLMMAVMIAALMSDLDSIFNSASSLFTIDVWSRIRKNPSLREQMVVGRVFVLVMIGVAIAWVPVVKEMQGGLIFVYIQEVTGYLAPPVAAVFVMAVLWKRMNEKGAFWGLMAGLVVGLVGLVLVFIYPSPGACEEDTRPAIVSIHYMYIATILYWITTIVTVVVSLATPPPKPEHLLRTTFWTRFDRRSLEEVRAGVQVNDKACQTYDNPASEMDGPENISPAEPPSQGEKEIQDLTIISGTVMSDHQPGEMEEESKWRQRLISFFCGVTSSSEDNEGDNEEQSQHAAKIALLEQTPMERLILNVSLVVILATGVFLYCFWSLWKYVPGPVTFYT